MSRRGYSSQTPAMRCQVLVRRKRIHNFMKGQQTRGMLYPHGSHRPKNHRRRST